MDKILPFLTKSSHISIQMFEIRMKKQSVFKASTSNTDCSQKNDISYRQAGSSLNFILFEPFINTQQC